MKGSPAKPPRYPSARYNQQQQQQPSAPPLSPPPSHGGEDDGIPPMPLMPALSTNLSGVTDELPSYMDSQMLLPPLAVPLGYGSGSPPPLYDSVTPAMPVYRQQYQPASPYRMPPPPLASDASGQTPPGVYFQYSANASANPPQAFDMHRPRGSHRAYHQMYRQQSPQNQQQQPPSKCASVCYFLKLLLFNAANGFLGVAGFAVVSVGLTLALVTLPLCCFGIVLFRVLLRVVYVGCKIDAVLHNLIASSDEKIQFGAHHPSHHHHPGHMSSRAERHSLLPTQIDWQLQPHHQQQDEDQLPQFEKTLAEVSPHAVLATIYFGSIKFLVGIFSLIAIGLASFVIAFFIDSDNLQLKFDDDEDVHEEDPFTMYMFAIGLAMFSVAMLFANARISQAITRFFCCEGGV